MENSYNPQEKQYKLLLIGEQAVGKSSLMNRYVDNVFEMNIMGTAGLDLKKKIVEIKGEKIHFDDREVAATVLKKLPEGDGPFASYSKGK